MKIALLTIWHVKNYGAELQAYATVKALRQLGHQVEMIDIRLSDCHKPNLNGMIGNVVSSFGPAYHKFFDFWRKYIPVTKRYRSLEQIQNDPPMSDVYMVGSDQVWNPDLTGDFAKLFFLDFGGNHVKRISFASSFGTEQWRTTRLTEDVRQLIRRFDFIGCREQSGVDILRDTFNMPATLTVDPTLLFDQYPELTGNLTPKRTLVCYPLSKDPDLIKFSQETASRLGLQLVNNKQTSTVFGRFTWDKVSIEEWIRNIAESQFVITRSFHGLAFSILYRKSFAIIANTNNRSTRLLNLLQQLGLTDRYFENFRACEEAKPWNMSIDYDAVHDKLMSLRKDSFDFLNRSLL